MQGPSKSNAATPAFTQPLTVVDGDVLARVAGGAGPHGGWAVPAGNVAHGALGSEAGPHGGWSIVAAGPHGGW